LDVLCRNQVMQRFAEMAFKYAGRIHALSPVRGIGRVFDLGPKLLHVANQRAPRDKSYGKSTEAHWIIRQVSLSCKTNDGAKKKLDQPSPSEKCEFAKLLRALLSARSLEGLSEDYQSGRD
jgi:hypothetical protein